MRNWRVSAGAFALGYVAFLLPTYVLPYLGSNAALLRATAGAFGVRDTTSPGLFAAHLACLGALCGIAGLRGRVAGRRWLVVLPAFALVFDLAPGLSLIPLVPTVLHVLTIVLGVSAGGPGAAGTGVVAVAAPLLALQSIACAGDGPRAVDRRAADLPASPARPDASPARVARLATALRGADYAAAMAAADSLARVGPAATGALAPLIAGTDVQARELAVRAVAGYGPDAASAVPALTTVVRRGADDRAFVTAVQALGGVGPAAAPAAGALAAVLDDPTAFHVRQHVLRALGAIGPGARAALPAVLRQLPTAPHGGAAAAAGRIGGPDALGALERELLAPARSSAGNPPDTVAVALARFGAPGLAVLARAAAAEQPVVRRAAVVGYRAAGAAGVPGLVRALADPRPCEYPYGTLGDYADPVACQSAAARALGEVGRPASAALPALERLLREATDAGPQDAARTAIARIRA